MIEPVYLICCNYYESIPFQKSIIKEGNVIISMLEVYECLLEKSTILVRLTWGIQLNF